ncbi:hypothetical protein K456DRAFT_1713641 [Colletotrichum gloeosporioides 23]|nr:hypothetical protein K456DRAFT_1713641 [Colletotrichum gloeosporioides 23]
MGPGSHGLTYMARYQVLRLASSCEFHRSDVSLVAETMIDTLSYLPQEVCICQQIGTIIHNTSVIALALAHCKFDPLELRIPETSLTQGKSQRESWCTKFIPLTRNATMNYTPDFDGETFEHLLDYLAQVFCIDHSREWTRNTSDTTERGRGSWQILGLSGGTYTIHFFYIMENDCFDSLGRTISIRTGRASVAGTFRNTIDENLRLDWDDYGKVRRGIMAPSLLAGGSLLQPHYRPPRTSISMHVALHETIIELTLQVESLDSGTRRWEFTECLIALLSGTLMPSCEHGLNSAYVLQKDQELAVEGFHIGRFKERSPDQVLILALQGNKLEQLLACGMLIHESEEKAREMMINPPPEDPCRKKGVLQTSSCLGCCIRLSQKDDNCLPWVIIGS